MFSVARIGFESTAEFAPASGYRPLDDTGEA